jgi:2-octaprenylphenol hydroxylase
MVAHKLAYDVTIVGGGLVGATLACALADSGLHIAIIEQQPLAKQNLKDTFDLRVSAINHATQRIFNALGIWEAMVNARVAPIRQIQVFDANSNGRIHFNCQELSEAYLGHIVEHSIMQQALYQRLLANKDITIIDEAVPTAFYQGADQHLLMLADGRQITSPLIVAADGAHSWLRTQAGIKLREQPYGHTAIVATVTTEQPHQNTAWQRFLPTGPLAFLPLAENHTCSIVWSVETITAQRLLQLDDTAFNYALAEATAGYFGKITTVSTKASFPLARRHAQQYVKPGIALIGDAAHTIHPLAGQGFNLGVMDAACLAEVILDAKQQGESISSFKNLRRYERWRKEDVITLLTTMETFKRLFGSTNKPIQLLRGWGLNLTQRLNPIKKHLMRRAMGLTGDLPKLARNKIAD